MKLPKDKPLDLAMSLVVQGYERELYPENKYVVNPIEYSYVLKIAINPDSIPENSVRITGDLPKLKTFIEELLLRLQDLHKVVSSLMSNPDKME